MCICECLTLTFMSVINKQHICNYLKIEYSLSYCHPLLLGQDALKHVRLLSINVNYSRLLSRRATPWPGYYLLDDIIPMCFQCSTNKQSNYYLISKSRLLSMNVNYSRLLSPRATPRHVPFVTILFAEHTKR